MGRYIERTSELPMNASKIRAHKPFVDENSGEVSFDGNIVYKLNLQSGWGKQQQSLIAEHNSAHDTINSIIGEGEDANEKHWDEDNVSRLRQASGKIIFTNNFMLHGRYRGNHKYEEITAKIKLEINR